MTPCMSEPGLCSDGDKDYGEATATTVTVAAVTGSGFINAADADAATCIGSTGLLKCAMNGL
ncbi:MAG: hypothetical protein AAFR30_10435 [Cyanobacteria bacterium J06628_4]